MCTSPLGARAALLVTGHLRDACHDWDHLKLQVSQCKQSFVSCDVYICTWNTSDVRTYHKWQVQADDAYACAQTIAQDIEAVTLQIDRQLTPRETQARWSGTNIPIVGVEYNARALASCALHAARHHAHDACYSAMFRLRAEKRFVALNQTVRFDVPTVNANEIWVNAPVGMRFTNIDNALWGDFENMLMLLQAHANLNMTGLHKRCNVHPEHTIIAAAVSANLRLRRLKDHKIVSKSIPTCRKTHTKRRQLNT